MNNMYEILEKLNSVAGRQSLNEGWKGSLAGGVAGSLAGSAAAAPLGPVGSTVGGAIGGMAGSAVGDALGGPDEVKEEQLNEIGPALAAGAAAARGMIGRIAQALGRGGKAAADATGKAADKVGGAAADAAGKVGSAAADAAGKVGSGVADVAKSVGQSAAQNAGKIGLGVGAYEIASQMAEKMPDALNRVYTDTGEAAKAIAAQVGNSLGSATVMELATSAVKYAIPLALLLAVLYGGKKLIDKVLDEDAMMEGNDMRDLLNKLDYVTEGWKGTAAGAGLGAVLGGPLGAAAGALAGDKIGDEMEEGSTGDYSAKKARAGRDIGKPGKQFAKIAKSAGERYGSQERGEKVAGAVLAKLRKGVKEDDMEEGNDFTGARLAAIKAGKPTFRVDGKTYKVTGDTSDERQQVDELDLNLLKAAQKHSKEHPGSKDAESERNIHKKYGYRTDRDDSEEGDDDDYDEWGNFKGKKKKASKTDDGTPKKRGRPKGTTGRSIGAKSTGLSKLARKGAIKEHDMEQDGVPLIDKGEYDREGEMAKGQLHTIEAAAKELHDILGDDQNLPEWIQSKITKAMDYIDTARDYMASQEAEHDEVMPERKLTRPEMKKREEIVKSMKKSKGDFERRYGDRGEAVMYATATKQAKKTAEESKDKKEVEETTVAGSVAPAAAEGGKKSKGGMQFGKGVYESKLEESYKSRLEKMLTEGVSISANQSEDGKKTLTVNATDEDAIKLAQILQLAGMPQGSDYKEVCPACGSSPCGCEGLEEGELANSPDTVYANTELINTQGEDLNAPKSTGQTTTPVLNRDPARQGVRARADQMLEQAESRLWDLYKKY